MIDNREALLALSRFLGTVDSAADVLAAVGITVSANALRRVIASNLIHTGQASWRSKKLTGTHRFDGVLWLSCAARHFLDLGQYPHGNRVRGPVGG